MANLALAMSASGSLGCSLLYNPSNLPPQQTIDAAVDTPDAEVLVDANAGMLMLTGASPAVIVEGAGANGSRSAVLVVDGAHMVKDGAMVTLAPAPGSPKTPMVMVDNSQIIVEGNGMRLAVPITLPVDTGLGATDAIAMDITVTQLANGAPATTTLTGKLTIRGLPELDTAMPHVFGSVNEFSFINLRAGSSVSVAGGLGAPVVIHSTSSLTIASGIPINVNASGQTPGPAGGRGGNPGPGGLLNGSKGGEGEGPAKGLPSGGGGGFNAPESLTSLDNPNRSSGGAGGDGLSLGAEGGAGGGGGGSIALIADGDLAVGAINARGVAGTAPAGANPGGGGSGGVVYVHAGRNLMLGAVDVSGGGNGAAGRARYEAGGTATVATPTMFRGPAFVSPPLITKDERPTIAVVGAPLKAFQFYWTNASGQQILGPFSQTFPGNGMTNLAFPSGPGLYRGLNMLCLLVAGADATSNTKSCIELAYLYAP